MKRILLIMLIFSIFSSSSLFSQPWGNDTGTLSSGNEGEVKWESKLVDFGEIKQYNPKEAIFKFTNKGGKPIIITNAKGSCGCTEIEFSKKPVLPGKSTEIIATFDAEDLGVFNKTVTLTMNIEKSSQVLRLKGTVIR